MFLSVELLVCLIWLVYLWFVYISNALELILLYAMVFSGSMDFKNIYV